MEWPRPIFPFRWSEVCPFSMICGGGEIGCLKLKSRFRTEVRCEISRWALAEAWPISTTCLGKRRAGRVSVKTSNPPGLCFRTTPTSPLRWHLGSFCRDTSPTSLCGRQTSMKRAIATEKPGLTISVRHVLPSPALQ